MSARPGRAPGLFFDAPPVAFVLEAFFGFIILPEARPPASFFVPPPFRLFASRLSRTPHALQRVLGPSGPFLHSGVRVVPHRVQLLGSPAADAGLVPEPPVALGRAAPHMPVPAPFWRDFCAVLRCEVPVAGFNFFSTACVATRCLAVAPPPAAAAAFMLLWLWQRSIAAVSACALLISTPALAPPPIWAPVPEIQSR